MKKNWESFKEQFEKMPIYGKLREQDERLTFGQYLTVLKEWWEKTEREGEGFEKELREMLANDEMSPLIRIKEVLGE